MNKNIIFAILIAFVSCGPKVAPKEIAKAEALQEEIDSVAALISNIDTAKGFASSKHYFENMQYIQMEMTDTIPKYLAYYIDDYYGIRKAFRLFSSQYNLVAHQVEENQSQIANLLHDVNNGVIDETAYREYYDIESNNALITISAANELIYAIETAQPIYDSMNPRIDSLVAASKAKSVQPE